jgi:hypothetical protein
MKDWTPHPDCAGRRPHVQSPTTCLGLPPVSANRSRHAFLWKKFSARATASPCLSFLVPLVDMFRHVEYTKMRIDSGSPAVIRITQRRPTDRADCAAVQWSERLAWLPISVRSAVRIDRLLARCVNCDRGQRAGASHSTPHQCPTSLAAAMAFLAMCQQYQNQTSDPCIWPAGTGCTASAPPLRHGAPVFSCEIVHLC